MTQSANPKTTPPDLTSEEIQLPAVIARNERTARRGFWQKMARVAGRIPFAEEAASAYYAAIDPKTPTRVRATLLAALAYFVLPADLIPDIVTGLGFTDDATVLMTAIGIVSGHIKEDHKAKARAALHIVDTPTDR